MDYNLGMNLTKSDPRAYHEAMKLVGQLHPHKIYFVDDNLEFAVEAVKIGWNVIRKGAIDPKETSPNIKFSSVSSLVELQNLLPQLFIHE